jgi:hypothetical protein
MRGAIALVMRVARIRNEFLSAMPTLPLLASHVVPLAKPMTRRIHNNERTPKKSPTTKNTPA